MTEEHGGQPLVFVAAGGTGGHLFPAEALAVALSKRGVTVDLVTDERATRYGDFPGRTTHIVPSATFAGPNPFRLAAAAIKLCRGAAVSMRLMKRLHPAAVVGFGVAVPADAAAAGGTDASDCNTRGAAPRAGAELPALAG